MDDTMLSNKSKISTLPLHIEKLLKSIKSSKFVLLKAITSRELDSRKDSQPTKLE